MTQMEKIAKELQCKILNVFQKLLPLYELHITNQRLSGC